MATELWCELVCAHCATANYGEHVTGASLLGVRPKLKAKAREHGWQFHGDEAFCGETCWAKYQAEKQS